MPYYLLSTSYVWISSHSHHWVCTRRKRIWLCWRMLLRPSLSSDALKQGHQRQKVSKWTPLIHNKPTIYLNSQKTWLIVRNLWSVYVSYHQVPLHILCTLLTLPVHTILGSNPQLRQGELRPIAEKPACTSLTPQLNTYQPEATNHWRACEIHWRSLSACSVSRNWGSCTWCRSMEGTPPSTTHTLSGVLCWWWPWCGYVYVLIGSFSGIWSHNENMTSMHMKVKG